MLLSEHFSLEELTATSVRGVDNSPPELVLSNMKLYLVPLLERVRKILGDHPLHINSGFRSPAVNQRVGGAIHSAHIAGVAADFICPAFGTPLSIVRKLDASGLGFDKLIQEGGWVHISADPAGRRVVLTAHFHSDRPATYTAGA